MSGDDDIQDGIGSGHDHSIITTRLRACEACKLRKVRCDKLDPCSACKSSNIPCWTARPSQQQKRHRAAVSSKYEEQLSRVNEQLARLQISLDSLTTQNNVQVPFPTSNRVVDSIKQNEKTPSSVSSGNASSPNGIPYLGDSSFEVHSQQTGQILDSALHNSPAARQDVTASLQSLRDLQHGGNGNEENSFTTDLQMPSVQVALAALRIMEMLTHGFSLCSPFMDGDWFRNICQRVYFPVKGYSMADFIITNGGLCGILGMASTSQLRQFGIDAEVGEKAVALCAKNVSTTIAKMSVFLAPTFPNIEALLFGVQIAMVESDHNQAWYLISFAARLCMDSGLNRLKDNSDDIDELNRKKMVFWFTYAFDKAMSLNFGRSPNFSDYDISVAYPVVQSTSLQQVITVWFDLSRVQGRVYEKLYSAQGSQDSPELRAQNARVLASELLACQDHLKSIFAQLSDQEAEPFLDTEITIIVTLTIVYRALPSQKPAHPLRFSDECISVARETLQLHETLCSRFLARTDNQIRMYIDWNLSFCPFTPFIVILGTAILDTSAEDMHLLDQVVDSLERAAVHAQGAKKILGICKILLRGAKSCIEQSLSTGVGPPAVPQPFPARSQPAMSNLNVMPAQHISMPAVMDNENAWGAMPEDWTSLELDNPDNMSLLFDNYLAGNSGVMPIFDPDLTRFDMM